MYALVRAAVACMQVASLSWLERKAASMLYGAPPETSFEEALEQFRKVQQKQLWHMAQAHAYVLTCMYGTRHKT